MGLVVRQSFKSTLVTYVGVALGALNLLYFFPRYLNPELIGIRELLLGVALSLSIFTQLGLQSAMSRFFPYFQDEQRQHNGFLLFSLGVGAVGFLIFGGLFWFLRDFWQSLFAANSPEANRYWWMILPLTVAGGALGAYFGAKKWSPKFLTYLLAFVLAFAAVKLIFG